MRLPFAKMHALGNDFVVLDAVSTPLALSVEQLRTLGDRRHGIGCDQILLVEPAPHAGVDFGYRIFNADGSEVGQCGNGARCLLRFVHARGLSDARELRVATQSTEMALQLLDDGWVRARLPAPKFSPDDVPMRVAAQADRYEMTVEGAVVNGGAVNVGNPHYVLPVADVDSAPVAAWGRILSVHPDFPEGANIGFAQVVERGHLRLRVFERGVGETPACGSGACAAAVILQSWHEIDSRVIIDLPGGRLRIDRDGDDILMEGPATWVFDGEMTL